MVATRETNGSTAEGQQASTVGTKQQELAQWRSKVRQKLFKGALTGAVAALQEQFKHSDPATIAAMLEVQAEFVAELRQLPDFRLNPNKL